MYTTHKEKRADTAANVSAREWQGEFQELMAAAAISYDGVFNVKYMTGRSLNDALNESLSGELFLFVITCEWSDHRAPPTRGIEDVLSTLLGGAI